jgi:hypothetical protein
MNQNLSTAKGKKTSKDFTDQEKKDVVTYLEAHDKDPRAFEYLMKKYNCSNTTLTIICISKIISKERKENL